MGIEIERKFLLRNDDWRVLADEGVIYRQGYLVGGRRASVRVRLEGEQAFLNIKSVTLDVTRLEFEYPVPREDAETMLTQLCEKPLIEKRRYRVPYAGRQWEIDVFEGENAGLVVAEIELSTADEEFPRPPWLGEEVSHDPRYYNVNLVHHPYRAWGGDGP